MQNLRQLFEGSYPGKETLFNTLIKPIFAKAEDLTLTTERELSDADKKQIKSFKIFAQVRGGFPVTFADVELKDSVALKRSRVNIQNCVRKIMKEKSNAIIFFHFTDDKSEWRVSYVNIGENLKNATNAKRYTYLCGPEHSCRTITERFEELQNISGKIKDADMIKAFSIEPISNDFFDQYKEIYANLVEYISGKRFIKKGGKFVEEKTKNANPAFAKTFDGDDKLVRDYVKKLMGRLVFLQFLQKKGWLGVKENEAWGSGDKNFLYNLFNKASDNIQKDFLESALEPLFFKTLNVERKKQNDIAPKELCDIYGTPIRIPYLNGGLFEEDEVDKKKVKFKAEHFREIFDFFNQYNFTIDETDSDEKELGVDPEMLGKIFENLLEDNKDKGAFYTPKEIVQYMCSESLIAYLLTDTKIAENKIRTLVAQKSCENLDLTKTEKTELETKLKNIKICDPAVGSGAFPMGMLNELYDLRVALNQKENNLLSSQELAQIKKDIVKQNIYGVDIEKGAIDIARLRFWLSIIVDEEEPLPLPNLDYKLMQGNSLLESFEGVDLSKLTMADTIFDDNEDIVALVNILDGYFDEHIEKIAIRESIKCAVIDLIKKRGVINSTYEALQKMDLHQNDKFFLWHTWFNDVFTTKGGFDVVIGNPPYVNISNIKPDFYRKILQNSFYSAKNKSDLYAFFIEKGFSLLNKKGIQTYIVPHTWKATDSFKNLREIIIKEHSIFQIVNQKMGVFNAIVNPMIIILGNELKNNYEISVYDGIGTFKYNIPITEILDDVNFAINSESSFEEKEIFKKIELVKYRLKDIIEFSRGIKTSDDKRFILMSKKDKDCKKVYRGRNIKPYEINWADEYVWYRPDLMREKTGCLPHTKEFFEVPEKLVTQRVNSSMKLFVAYDNEQNYFLDTTNVSNYLTWNKEFSLKFICGILNSKVINYWYPRKYRMPTISGYELSSIPIPNATPAEQAPIIALVEKILEAKKQDPASNTSTLEKQIDTLVYKLYGLTAEEIAIVEG